MTSCIKAAYSVHNSLAGTLGFVGNCRGAAPMKHGEELKRPHDRMFLGDADFDTGT